MLVGYARNLKKMTPNLSSYPLPACTSEQVQLASLGVSGNQKSKFTFVWRRVVWLIVGHALALYGLWIVLNQSKWKLFIYQYTFGIFIGMGITAGAHRLWSHRTYEAKLPLKILLMILQTMSLQDTLYKWSRDHRCHHKYTDTNADPHNATRGFFFSHMGWLMVKKQEEVFIKSKMLDLSDLEADPVVMFQKKYYAFAPILSFIPCIFPCYFWGETWWNSFLIAGVLRYILSLNYTWLVNSAAHIFGSKPYDKTINPTENNLVAFLANGEGWHNYHHVFPWDYKAAELGNYRLNTTTAFLDLMAKIGWAYNLKTASPDLVKKRSERTGDGSWVKDSCKTAENAIVVDYHHGDRETVIWGWGDKDMKAEDVDHIKRYNNLKTM